MGSYNHQIWVYWFNGSSQNVRSSREFHSDTNISGKLFPGCLFWATGSVTNPSASEDCKWEIDDYNGLDYHDLWTAWYIEGYFDLATLVQRWVADFQAYGLCNSANHRHTQHTTYCTCWHAYPTCFLAEASRYWISDRSMLFIDWIYAETINGPTQNFRRRVYNGTTYYGARVLWNNKSLKDPSGNHVGYLNRNNWVWFTYSYPPATGATLHDHIRIRAYSLTPDGTMYFGNSVFFFDNDTNYKVGMTWEDYNIATMPTGGPV